MTQSLSPIAPLLHRPIFRNLWIGNQVSNLGTQIQGVGAAWMMMSLTASLDMVALVQSSLTLPAMLVSLFAGALADSFSRRNVMLLAQTLMLVTAVLLTFAAYENLLTPWLLLTFTFLLGCGNALNNPSWQASVGDVVDRTDLSAAINLNSMGFNLSRTLGPALGGVIVAVWGAIAAFAANATSFIVPIIVLLSWRPRAEPSPLPREAVLAGVLAGVRYVSMSLSLHRVLLRSFLFGFAATSIVALMPLIARDILHGGPLMFGVLSASFGIGAVGGSLVASAVRRALSAEAAARLSFAGLAVCAAVAAVSTNPVVTGLALGLGGASWVNAQSLFNLSLQMLTPRWVVGRSLSILHASNSGGMAVGSWCWGLMAEAYGPDAALLGAAVSLLGGAALGLRRFALPALSSVSLEPANLALPQALAGESKAGSVVVTTEYRVKPGDTADFLQAMVQWRRVRQRDGARQWSLTRDSENGELWLEIYRTPSWIDYVRLNQRMMKDDIGIAERIASLHSGCKPPRVRCLVGHLG